VEAIESKNDFKVYVMIPLQTAAPATDSVTKEINNFEYSSIFRGPKSIYETLKEKYPNVNINKYIVFTSLRTYERLPFEKNSFITEIVNLTFLT
jgi:hypothetical protein